MIPEIQYITRDDNQFSHAQQARIMFENGIKWVQIRMKNATKEEIISQAKEALTYARSLNGKIIINDSVEIAKMIYADGVHIGLKDMPADEAREILGENFIIGGTANSVDDILTQVRRGVSYVGVGPFRFTETKKNLSPVIGLEGYRTIVQELKKRNVNTPLVAVGGITMNDTANILATGIQSMAISGALWEKFKPEIQK